MIECKGAIYCKAIDFVMDRLQFEKPIVKNNLYVQIKNNQDQRLGKAKHDGTSNQTINH